MKMGDIDMFKWVSWAARILVTAVLLSFLSIWTTGYIVNSYMETLLKQMDLPLQTQPFALSGIWGKMWGASPAPKPKSDTQAKTNEASNATTSGSKETTVQPSPSSSVASPDPGMAGEQASPGSPTPSEDKAVPVFGTGAGTSQMTEQQRTALDAVMSKLNADQLAQLSALLKNGLTKEELTQLGVLIKPSLSETEYNQMMDLLQTRTEASAAPSSTP
jgi:hypothetical protein